MKNKIIRLSDVSFDYEKAQQEKEEAPVFRRKALAGVSLSVEEGEFLALVGHNGSGKSTLAKMLNGLLIPQSGSVEIFGKTTGEPNNLLPIRREVGMVFQNPDNQMIASIVEEDVAFGPENLGVPQPEIVERVGWALSSVGMEEFASRTPYKLSGGQKQRIAIAGVLAIKPKVLVLDESTAMLDPAGRREVLQVVKRLNREEKMTVILITHFMDEVLDCDRVVVLFNGKIEMEGTPKEIFLQSEKLKEIGLEAPLIVQLASGLAKEGVPVDPAAGSVSQLGEELCRLL